MRSVEIASSRAARTREQERGSRRRMRTNGWSRRVGSQGIGALLLAACGGSAPPAVTSAPAPSATPSVPVAAAPAVSTPQVMSADTPKTSAFGSTFTVPAGWSYAETENARILEGPEHDYTMAVVDVKGADADEATCRAWAVLEPKLG
jgi:hypothetical protein